MIISLEIHTIVLTKACAHMSLDECKHTTLSIKDIFSFPKKVTFLALKPVIVLPLGQTAYMSSGSHGNLPGDVSALFYLWPVSTLESL